MRPLACLLFWLIPVCGWGQTGKAPPALQGVKRIVCLGDSITQFGEAPGGYVWLVRHYLNALYPQQNIEVINAGISGHKSDDMLARFQKDVLDRKPDLVTISVGVNDVWHKALFKTGVPLEAYRRNLDTMVTQAQKAGARVVLLSPTMIRENFDSPSNSEIAVYQRAMREVAARHQALFVDYLNVFRRLIAAYRKETGGRDNLLTEDGVHMNAQGNQVMAHVLLTAFGVSSRARQAALATVERARQPGK